MTLEFSEDAYLAYLATLLKKSPNIVKIVEKALSEDIDLDSAISAGLIPATYIHFSQKSGLIDLENSLYDFYAKFKKHVAMFSSTKYAKFIEVFYEVYDIEKALSLISSRSKPSQRIALLSSILVADEAGAKLSRDYSVCIENPDVRCFYRIYITRVDEAVTGMFTSTLSGDYLRCKTALHLFILTQYLSHKLNCALLKLCRDIELAKLASELKPLEESVVRVDRVFKTLEAEASRDLSKYTLYEVLHLLKHVREILGGMNSAPSLLTYILIYKFYEYKIVRLLSTMKFVRWGAK